MRRSHGRSPARPATCRSAPISWSTGGTITASASRVPTCRQGSARRMPARLPCGQIGAMGGVRGRDRARSGPQRLAEIRRSLPFGLDRPSRCSGPAWGVAADPNAPAFARASAPTELAPYVSPANINLARSALARPRSDGTDRRARHARKRLRRANLAAGIAAARRFQSRREHAPWRCLPRFRP